jgi:hypothetical protein
MRHVITAAVLGLVCAIGSSATLDAKGDASRPSFVIRLLLAEETSEQSNGKAVVRRVAEPTIVTAEKTPAEIRVGGTKQIGDESIDFGTSAKFACESENSRSVRVRGKIEVSNISTPSSDSAVRHSTTVYIDRLIALGKTERLMIDDKDGQRRWCDITVNVFNDRQ